MLAFIVENAMTILFVVGIILAIAVGIVFSLSKKETHAGAEDELFSVIPTVGNNPTCCATTAAAAVSEDPAKPHGSTDHDGDCCCGHT